MEPHSALARRPARVPLRCGAEGKLVAILYGDNRIGIEELCLTISGLVEAPSNIYVEGLCHQTGDMVSLRLDLIHRVQEMPSGSVHEGATAWLASFGIEVGIHRDRLRMRCRVLASPGRGSSGSDGNRGKV